MAVAAPSWAGVATVASMGHSFSLQAVAAGAVAAEVLAGDSAVSVAAALEAAGQVAAGDGLKSFELLYQ